MYINYCQLSEMMIKDKFSIPFIEDLLDELKGVAWSTKLDLQFVYGQI